MPLLLDTVRSGAPVELPGASSLTIGLVNNMPDSAWQATERQFLDLIRAASSGVVIRVKLFSISDVPRADHVREKFAERYRDVSELWATRLDGLIVTGTEPRAANLKDEPYWPTLTTLTAWARENTASTIWSCLAAHAAVLYADAIERQPLEEKRFGVFDCQVLANHPLMAGVGPRPRVPHSRYNDLSAPALTACGYRLLTTSALAGVDAFARVERGFSLFVFFQGHPEYDAETLPREYRRDVGRFLRGEREHYPAMPEGCFNEQARALAEAFRARALGDRRESLAAEFPMSGLGAEVENTWHHSAVNVYENWINYLKDRKLERRRVPGQGGRREAWSIGDAPQPADASSAR